MSRTATNSAISKIIARPRSRGAAGAKRAQKSSAVESPLVVSTGPDWARDIIFERSKIVAFEGWANPLQPTLLYPPNAAFIRNLGLKLRDQAAWMSIVHPLDRARVAEFFEKIENVDLPHKIEYRVIDAQGAVVWLRQCVETAERRGKQVRIRGLVEDIQAEKEFQLESLRVSEREQNRIGQDLHDDLCQVLAGLSCLMRVFEGRIGAKAPEEVDTLKELNQQIVDAMHRTRALTHGLFPGKIQIADIRGALLELASQIKARFKVEIRTEFVGRFRKHSTAQIIQIYRISQEALTNAMKHGRATEMYVRLEAHAREMELLITDNGTGFPADNAEPGVGLNIMKYRAAMLGGNVAITNPAPNGVRVQLRYPFEPQG